ERMVAFLGFSIPQTRPEGKGGLPVGEPCAILSVADGGRLSRLRCLIFIARGGEPMALFDADKAGVLWDAVALPNAFICEYMPSAPEGYVKVYLYGLLYAHFPQAAEGLTATALAKELGMEENDVLAAFQYWERCRIVTRTQDQPPRFLYLSVQQAMMGRQTAPADETYMQFAQALYAIFGDKRKLYGGETQLCYEWVEQLGLPREVVLMLVQHLATTRGVNFSFKDAQKLAVELTERHIVTLEDAEQFFARSQAAWEGTQRVLRRISKFRSPTVDEIDLYLKWTKEWGFAPKAVEAACAEMTGGDPSFKYLDSILRGVHERGNRKVTTPEQLEKQLTREKSEAEQVREVLRAAGLSANANQDTVREVYRAMREKLPHETIVLAAREISRKKKTQSLDKLAELVDAWSAKGLTDVNDVNRYLAQVKEQNDRLRELFTLLGWGSLPTPRDRELLAKWRGEWAIADDVLNKAAEYSAGKNAPMAFMDKVLDNYRANGVTTAAQAEADHEKHREAYQPKVMEKPPKTVIEQRYGQRDYDPEKVDGLTAKEIEEALRYDT
ncbi:MAG TPA: DnaD domain protein, partial [Candidatus Limiplasma sp.]|nr:DnaD domain protein [Candidatus Limiplasma sp.]